jgi:hypothetical protein
MPFCTIVEFEWNAGVDRAGLEGMMVTGRLPAPSPVVGFEVSSYRTA